MSINKHNYFSLIELIKRPYASIFIGLITFLGANSFAQQKTENKIPQEHWITIFVHGIISVKPHLSVNNFIRFINDEIENTMYAKAVELMRKDHFFYQNQAMQGYGLQPIQHHLVAKGQTASALAYLFEEISHLSNIKQTNYYYTFGWSGLLSPTMRYRDAVVLFEELENLVQKFKHDNIHPKIRIIGYSHGGNVCLNLGAVHKKEYQNSTLAIDELVLLGTPVQYETDHYINDSIFKKIYHIYSLSDRIQQIDFFSLNRFFSRRTFKARPGFKLPDKLIQIQLKIMRFTTSARHNPKKHHQAWNLNNCSVVAGKTHFLRNASPGHSELWFFGWTPLHYREKFPLFPLPAISLLPYILQQIKQVEFCLTPRHKIIMDVRPEQELTIIKERKGNKIYKADALIPYAQIERLKDFIYNYKPDNYSQEQYNQHIQTALEKAEHYHAAHIAPKRRKRHRRRSKELHNQPYCSMAIL